MNTKPKHGELRHHGFRTDHGELVEFMDQRTGEVALRAPVCSLTESVTETWCGHCQRWIKTNGVLGPIRFMGEHQDGGCIKVGPATV